jgi:SAM-dependent methyltransferase
MSVDPTEAWLRALEQRHLATLTPSEVGRALRALSSCYVERRARLAAGGALDSAGKRAAFALFYAPLHLIVVGHILEALQGCSDGVRAVVDIGCGTGSAGAAWALQAGGARVHGVDRNPWAVAEANWTYPRLGLSGRAVQRDAAQARLEVDDGTAVIAAYTVNELPEEARSGLLQSFDQAHRRGARVLIVEPIARRTTPWWAGWERAVLSSGGRSDEWRFPSRLPERQKSLAKSAGLDPRELTARTLYWPPVG